MQLTLKDRVEVVTGAASGIGQEIARAFARAGARVAVFDMDAAGAEAMAREFLSLGTAGIALAVDVSNEVQVDAAMTRVIEDFGRIDILVSNAGNQIVGPLEDFAFADWKRVLAVHLDGAFLTTRAALRKMYRQGGGSIIYLGSVKRSESRRKPWCAT